MLRNRDSGPFDQEQGKEVESFEELEEKDVELERLAALPVAERMALWPRLAEGDATQAIAMQILGARTAEEVGEQLEARSVSNLKLAGETVTIHGFALSPSRYAEVEGNCPDFAMVDAVTMDGEPLVFAIGGWGPVFQLGRWHELGSFPVFQKIVEIPSKTPGYRAAFRFVNA